MLSFSQFALILSFAFVLSACSSLQVADSIPTQIHPEPFEVGSTSLNIAAQPDELIVYKTAGETELMLHLFHAQGTAADVITPAIILFHGGGWRSGNPSLLYDHADYFSKQGVLVVSVQYRLQNSHDTPPLVSLSDAKSAFRWLRKNADKLKIDETRIAAGGASTGGHLAAALASVDGFDDHRDDSGISTIPSALILFNPVIDNGPSGYGYERVAPYWQAFSPLHNIKHDHPPTIFFLGSQDRHIPVETAYAYKQAIETGGGRVDLHIYEGKKHGFFNRRTSSEAFRDTIEKTHYFLHSYRVCRYYLLVGA